MEIVSGFNEKLIPRSLSPFLLPLHTHSLFANFAAAETVPAAFWTFLPHSAQPRSVAHHLTGGSPLADYESSALFFLSLSLLPFSKEKVCWARALTSQVYQHFCGNNRKKWLQVSCCNHGGNHHHMWLITHTHLAIIKNLKNLLFWTPTSILLVILKLTCLFLKVYERAQQGLMVVSKYDFTISSLCYPLCFFLFNSLTSFKMFYMCEFRLDVSKKPLRS